MTLSWSCWLFFWPRTMSSAALKSFMAFMNDEFRFWFSSGNCVRIWWNEQAEFNIALPARLSVSFLLGAWWWIRGSMALRQNQSESLRFLWLKLIRQSGVCLFLLLTFCWHAREMDRGIFRINQIECLQAQILF